MILKVFASIGVIATFILVVTFVALFSSGIEELINEHRYKKRIKNRFNGGPTAKCFCRDCRYYNETSKPDKYNHGAGNCTTHRGDDVKDSWYCWKATPVDYYEAKRRKKNEKRN